MSVEQDFTLGSPQHTWLGLDLGAVDRAKTPWVVVTNHRQIWLGSETGGLMGKEQQDLEPLFLDHNVDLVLTAHEHGEPGLGKRSQHVDY